jgi:ribulose-bisphosphate carboxylase large chain
MTLIPQTVPFTLSGERFQVAYRIQGTHEECEARAKDICLEQTVEFPDDLVPDGAIRDCIVGRVESLEPIDASACRATISYPTEAAADDLSQLLNVMMGNTSIKPGIVVERLDLSPGLAGQFRGPRFGRSGLRDLLDVHDRPLLSTALKPMGLAPVDLGELAYRFALGGIDLIKDDHGLTNQTFCPFQERVKYCADAVARANRETGMRCLYVANITAPPEEMFRRARQAKAAGP